MNTHSHTDSLQQTPLGSVDLPLELKIALMFEEQIILTLARSVNSAFCLICVKICNVLKSIFPSKWEKQQKWKLYLQFISTCPSGALCSFEEEMQTQNVNLHSLNEVKVQTQKYLLFP